MSDPFVAWKMMQEQVMAAQKAQLEAATKLLGMSPHMDGALKAAQSVADANSKAWETWMGMWGMRK